jgi:hypothetical protein
VTRLRAEAERPRLPISQQRAPKSGMIDTWIAETPLNRSTLCTNEVYIDGWSVSQPHHHIKERDGTAQPICFLPQPSIYYAYPSKCGVSLNG